MLAPTLLPAFGVSDAPNFPAAPATATAAAVAAVAAVVGVAAMARVKMGAFEGGTWEQKLWRWKGNGGALN